MLDPSPSRIGKLGTGLEMHQVCAEFGAWGLRGAARRCSVVRGSVRRDADGAGEVAQGIVVRGRGIDDPLVSPLQNWYGQWEYLQRTHPYLVIDAAVRVAGILRELLDTDLDEDAAAFLEYRYDELASVPLPHPVTTATTERTSAA